MIPRHKPASYYVCNEPLLRAVPPTAMRIMDVGCGAGNLGEMLKRQSPRRVVLGIECEREAAARASGVLDHVFSLDVEKEDPPLGPGQLDCILYADVLEHFIDPEAVLRRHRRLLAPNGIILCSVPNIQHHSVLAALLKSDFQYAPSGLLDATHLRFFTYSTITKMLLDTGFAPGMVSWIHVACPAEFLEAAGPLLRHLGLNAGRMQKYLSAHQYIFRGTPVAYLGDAESTTELASRSSEPAPPFTFVACVSNKETLEANLLSSPCLAPGSPHEVLTFNNPGSAAEAFNQGIAQARHPLVVCVHQDVYLPEGWPERFWQQYRLAEKSIGAVGVAGVYGIRGRNNAIQRVGHIVDRDTLLKEAQPLPAELDTLDEVLLAVPRDTPCRFDADLGFHFYGADFCLAVRERGLHAVAVDALCFHNSLFGELPEAYFQSGSTFARKWSAHLPVATTSCERVDASWQSAPPRFARYERLK